MHSGLKKRIRDLKDVMNMKNALTDYWGIQNNDNSNISFKVKVFEYSKKAKVKAKVKFDIHYTNYNAINGNTINFMNKYVKKIFTSLPLEICDEILSYVYVSIDIKTELIMTDSYPFRPLIWRLNDVQHNLDSNYNLHAYYQYIIDSHNKQNKKRHAPSSSILSELLYMISLINNFEDIVGCV